MDHREANYAGHSPTCGCVECTSRRLGKWKREGKSSARLKSSSPRHSIRRKDMGKSYNTNLKKLLLNLLVTGLLVVVVWIGFQVFILHQWSSIVGAIIFLVVVGLLAWLISVLRNRYYRYVKPSFKQVFFSLFGISLVLAFAGVEPLVGYKDTVLVTVGVFLLLLLILSPFIIWFLLYFVIGPVFRIKIR